MNFKFFPNCLPCKGIKTTAVYDLQLGLLHRFPTAAFEGFTAGTFEKEESEAIADYLISLKLGYLDNITGIQSLTTDVERPNILSRLIVELSEHTNSNFGHISQLLKSTGATNLQLLVKGQLEELNPEVTNFIYDSGIEVLELFIPEEKSAALEAWISKVRDTNSAVVQEYPSELISDLRNTLTISYPQKFVSMEQVLEAQSGKNVYWNKLMAVDGDGYIRNGIEHPVRHAHVNDFQSPSEFIRFILSDNFSGIWNSSKDQSESCRNCELRWACVDNRVPEWNSEKSLWVFDEECPYNPDLD